MTPREKIELLKMQKNYVESLEWYEKLPKPQKNELIYKIIFLSLKINDYNKASKLLLDLKQKDLHIDEIPYSSVKGFIFQEQGNYENAIMYYDNENLLLNLAEVTIKNNKLMPCIKCYLKLSKITRRNKYKENAEEILLKIEEDLTVYNKDKIRQSLEKEFQIKLKRNELIICDTNIFVYAAFHRTHIYEILEYNVKKKIDKIVKQFNLLSGQHKVGGTATIFKQIISVCNGIFTQLKIHNKNDQDEIISRAKKYINKYRQNCKLNKDDYIKVVQFYEKYPFKMISITKRKIKDKSQRVVDRIIIKRAHGFLPEMSDMEILAECNALNNKLIRNVNKISLFSNDSDFTEFRDEINKNFRIKIY